MKTEHELFKLRERTLSFNNPLELQKNLLDFFDNDYNFPLVSGYKYGEGVEDKYANWKIQYLNRGEMGDELTVRNFLLGLEKISFLKESHLKNFKGDIFYDGVERRSADFLGKTILYVGFSNLVENYFLNIELSKISSNSNLLKDLRYTVKSGMNISKMGEVMSNYLGPNKK